MKKKIMSLCLVVALAAVTVVGGSLAYFTAKADKTNDFTVGNAKIELEEGDWDAALAADPNVHKNLAPGETVVKDPKVNNIGANPVYIRVKVEDKSGLDVTFQGYDEKWVEQNGYYYYMEEVAPGTGTTELFQSFMIPAEVENDYDGIERDINVYAEAVQSKGASANVLDSPANLEAWFNT